MINKKVVLIKQNECNSQSAHAAEAESRATGRAGGGRGRPRQKGDSRRSL